MDTIETLRKRIDDLNERVYELGSLLTNAQIAIEGAFSEGYSRGCESDTDGTDLAACEEAWQASEALNASRRIEAGESEGVGFVISMEHADLLEQVREVPIVARAAFEDGFGYGQRHGSTPIGTDENAVEVAWIISETRKVVGDFEFPAPEFHDLNEVMNDKPNG
jgi:hypothetical protein